MINWLSHHVIEVYLQNLNTSQRAFQAILVFVIYICSYVFKSKLCSCLLLTTAVCPYIVGEDFEIQNYHITITPGMTRSEYLRIDVVDDDIVEEMYEHYYLNISEKSLPKGVSATTHKYTRINIRDDDCKSKLHKFCNHSLTCMYFIFCIAY